jgi:hypothetical protein
MDVSGKGRMSMLVWNPEVRILWQYKAGDWVVEPGIPGHHLRIIQQSFDADSVRRYRVFDTV